jgi:hypothetical protein
VVFLAAAAMYNRAVEVLSCWCVSKLKGTVARDFFIFLLISPMWKPEFKLSKILIYAL